MSYKLIPITDEDARFEEKQLRQPRAVADLPQITDPESLALADEGARLDAQIQEWTGRRDAIRDALADKHLPDSGMTVQCGPLILSRYDRKGAVQWAKFAPQYLPADLNVDDFRNKTVEVVSMRRA